MAEKKKSVYEKIQKSIGKKRKGIIEREKVKVMLMKKLIEEKKASLFEKARHTPAMFVKERKEKASFLRRGLI